MSYDHKKIDRAWQKRWQRERLFKADDASEKPKFYALIEFPYPSGAGLHVGHVRSYTAMDVIARKRRMEGYEVLYPIGWDAFGLPAENFAIKTGRPPQEVTAENIATFKRQLQSLGISFDWSREVNTSDPNYYKWTQWMFLEFFKAGLCYKAKMPINWCTRCKIGLANEEAVGGVCERCGGPVEKREKEQWMIAITKYADRLLEDLKTVNYLPKIRKQQEDWIGRTEGAEIQFAITRSGAAKQPLSDIVVTVFTTRPDTIFGASFLVLAPEFERMDTLLISAKNKKEVLLYIDSAKRKSDIERGGAMRQKTGVQIEGVTAVNPADGKEIPVFVADFVLPGYGTGAIMGVPAHDERDHAFALAFGLPIIRVIEKQGGGELEVLLYDEDVSSAATAIKELGKAREYITPDVQLYIIQASRAEKVVEALASAHVGTQRDYDAIRELRGFTLEDNGTRIDLMDADVYVGDGPHKNSQFLDGLPNQKAIAKAIEWLEETKKGKRSVVYRLRDWIFSRQRYWGEPIPLVHCKKDGWVPVSLDQLPVLLPEVKKYVPTDTGESPLAAMKDWVETTCPQCGGPARRETDTMPNWAGSSWYFLRYIDAKNTRRFASAKKLARWMPVDWYNGGMEHTTLHLLYSRFWNKVLFDLGHVHVSEPYAKRTSHGLILAEGGSKMSKSLENTVSPDEIVVRVGADALRVFELFIGPFDQPVPWSDQGLKGVRKFLERVWGLRDSLCEHESENVTRVFHQTIQKVTEDIESMQFNTAVSQMMIFVNAAYADGGLEKKSFETFLTLLSPFAPHLAEELYASLGGEGMVATRAWPVFDAELARVREVTIGVQVNGKVRGSVTIAPDASESDARRLAEGEPLVSKYLQGKSVIKFVYVPARIINFVVN